MRSAKASARAALMGFIFITANWAHGAVFSCDVENSYRPSAWPSDRIEVKVENDLWPVVTEVAQVQDGGNFKEERTVLMDKSHTHGYLTTRPDCLLKDAVSNAHSYSARIGCRKIRSVPLITHLESEIFVDLHQKSIYQATIDLDDGTTARQAKALKNCKTIPDKSIILSRQ